jgi:anaphase-promoting complex subunit 1
MTEFLLAELGRRPAPDRNEARESVAFAAAWALGMVLLGKGGPARSQPGESDGPRADGADGAGAGENGGVANGTRGGGLGGLVDLCIEDRLQQHMEGGKRPPDSHLFPYAASPAGAGGIGNDAQHAKSSRVMEGDQINTGVTGPGAAIALGLVYVQSKNPDIARRLELPSTTFALESVRPDLLLYRAAARCLVLWDDAEPSSAWIDAQVPAVVTQVRPT